MSAHTPGPWEWLPAQRFGNCHQQMLDSRTAGRTVLFHDANWLPTKRDARLIAAAPLLLEALKVIRKHGWSPITQDLAKKAIAKAEGR